MRESSLIRCIRTLSQHNSFIYLENGSNPGVLSSSSSIEERSGDKDRRLINQAEVLFSQG